MQSDVAMSSGEAVMFGSRVSWLSWFRAYAECNPYNPGSPGGARCLHPLHHAPSALRVFSELPPPCQRSHLFAPQGKQSPVFLKHGVPSLTRHIIRLLACWVSRPRLRHENPHFRSSSISCCSPFSTLLYPLHSILRVLFTITWTIIPPSSFAPAAHNIPDPE